MKAQILPKGRCLERTYYDELDATLNYMIVVVTSVPVLYRLALKKVKKGLCASKKLTKKCLYELETPHFKKAPRGSNPSVSTQIPVSQAPIGVFFV